MKHISKPILIFSGERSNLSKYENDCRTMAIGQLLDSMKIPFNRALGSYQGIIENSFIVYTDHESTVKDLCKAFDQDCYLKIENDGHSSLWNSQGELITNLGTMRTYPNSFQTKLTAFTYLETTPNVIYSTEELKS